MSHTLKRLNAKSKFFCTAFLERKAGAVEGAQPSSPLAEGEISFRVNNAGKSKLLTHKNFVNSRQGVRFTPTPYNNSIKTHLILHHCCQKRRRTPDRILAD